MVKKFLFTLLLFPAFAFSTSTGEKLVRHFWYNAIHKHVHTISDSISPQFQGLYMSDYCNDRGGFFTKSQLLQFLKNATVSSFSLSNIKTTKNKHTLVVTYDVEVNTSIIKTCVLKKQPSSLTYHEIFTYTRKDKHWHLLSMAFFPILVD